MKYFVKMEIKKTGLRIEELKHKAMKMLMSKYEIKIEEECFFTNSRITAIAIRGTIRAISRRLKPVIYKKIGDKYLPLHTHKKLTKAEIEEILSLTKFKE